MAGKIIFNKNSLKLHRQRAATKLEQYNFLLKYSVASLQEKLQEVKYQHEHILDIGSRDQQFFRFLEQQADTLTIIDIAEANLQLSKMAKKFTLDEDLSVLPTNKFNLITSD